MFISCCCSVAGSVGDETLLLVPAQQPRLKEGSRIGVAGDNLVPCMGGSTIGMGCAMDAILPTLDFTNIIARAPHSL